MIKKELYFTFVKHWLLLVIPVIMLIMQQGFDTRSRNLRPTVAILGALNTPSGLQAKLTLKPVSSVEEGMQMVEKGLVDAFVLVATGEEPVVYRNSRSLAGYFVRPAIEDAFYPVQLDIEFVGSSPTRISWIYILLTLAGFGIPSLLFQDDKAVFKALVFSPVSNAKIVSSKFFASAIAFLLALIPVYVIVSDTQSIIFMVVLFFIGLVYISLGTLFGVFSGNSSISYLTHPIQLLLIILPILPNPLSNALQETLERALFASSLPVNTLAAVALLVGGLLAIDVLFFNLYVERTRR